MVDKASQVVVPPNASPSTPKKSSGETVHAFFCYFTYHIIVVAQYLRQTK
jgi:hypothetical protein